MEDLQSFIEFLNTIVGIKISTLILILIFQIIVIVCYFVACYNIALTRYEAEETKRETQVLHAELNLTNQLLREISDNTRKNT